MDAISKTKGLQAPARMKLAEYRALVAPKAKPSLKPKAKKPVIRRHMLGTEIQKACFAHFKLLGAPGAKMFAIPLGGLRDLGTARALKREGVEAGPLDTYWRAPGSLSGIWVEFKGKNEPLRDSQKKFIEWCELVGERWAVVRTLDEGLKLLEVENMLRRSAS